MYGREGGLPLAQALIVLINTDVVLFKGTIRAHTKIGQGGGRGNPFFSFIVHTILLLYTDAHLGFLALIPMGDSIL